jgi:hypothetical protein
MLHPLGEARVHQLLELRLTTVVRDCAGEEREGRCQYERTGDERRPNRDDRKAGPPAVGPIASDWFVIEITVARTDESGMFWFRQVS